MRHSLQKHNVARLRILIGEKQPGFAKQIGFSLHTLQSIESGRLKLSEELALRVSAATDVDVDWLLENNLEAEPVVAGTKWSPYTREVFQHAQARRQLGTPDFIASFTSDYLMSWYGQLRAIISSAAKRGESGVVILKLARYIDDLRKHYGHDSALVPAAEFRSRGDRSPVLTFPERDAGMTVIKQDVAELEEIKRQGNNPQEAARQKNQLAALEKRIRQARKTVGTKKKQASAGTKSPARGSPRSRRRQSR